MNMDTNDAVDTATSEESRPVHHVRHRPEDGEPLSTTVINAIAIVRDIDPTETRIPISESVDPDALDVMFSQGAPDTLRSGSRLVFEVWELEIVVRGNGHVSIRELK